MFGVNKSYIHATMKKVTIAGKATRLIANVAATKFAMNSVSMIGPFR